MLNWSWKNKAGYLVIDGQEKIQKNFPEYRITLYEGNAPFIAIGEWKKDDTDMYQPYTFFCDEDHAKRCLGLAKNSDCIMQGIKEVHLNVNMTKGMEKILRLWIKAIAKYHLETKIILEYTE